MEGNAQQHEQRTRGVEVVVALRAGGRPGVHESPLHPARRNVARAKSTVSG